MLSGLAEWVAEIVNVLGYAGLFLLVAVENLFPPIPSELILPLAGFLVSRGEMDFGLAATAATAGSLAGAMILYGIGALVGEDRIRRWIRRIPLVDERDADRGHAWFERHGGEAVLIGRLVPLVRSVVSLPAGVERMPLLRFVLYTVAGSLTWNVLMIGAGWFLGERWEDAKPWMSRYEIGVLAVLAVLVLAFVAHRIWSRRGGRR